MKPKKSLGQNFLKDEKVLAQIISAADLKLDDNIVEIGPGTGILTDELLKYAGKVVVIEKDDELAKKLKEKYKNNKKIEIIKRYVLKINLAEVIENNFNCHSECSATQSKNLLKNITTDTTKKILRLRPSTGFTQDDITPYKIIANIPYYITSPIIQLFLESEYPPSEMILMVQKEVAERICAPIGKMSILAVAVQYYANPELLFYVDKKSFWPVPEVDSAVIKISVNREQRTGNKEDTKKFFKTVKAGFSAKRKTLLNNLSNSFHLTKKEAEEKIKKAGLSPNQRAQELSVEDWKKLAFVIMSEARTRA